MPDPLNNEGLMTNTTIGPGSFTEPVVKSDIQIAKPTAVIQPPSNPNPGIVSSTYANNVLDHESSVLDKNLNQPDPYLEALQKQVIGIQNGTDTTNAGEEKNAIATATTNASNLKNKVQSDYAAYKAGLETLGIQSGLAQMAPELQAGRLLQAANDETLKIQSIQQKEDLAIARAKQARIDKDAVTLKNVNAEIAAIKKEKAQAIKDQLSKQTHDITVAKSLATYAYKTLATLPPEQKEAFLLQTAKDNGISPVALQNALADEQDVQTKFNLSTALQEKALNKTTGTSEKPVSTATLNYLKKNNPLVDLDIGATQADVDAAIAAAKEVQSGVKTAFNNPALVRNGRYTFDYINKALDNLPVGVSRIGFLTSIKDKLALGSDKNAKQYGITPEERQEILAE